MQEDNGSQQSIIQIYLNEFLTALKCFYSYHPLANPYFFFGFLWGVPVPIFIFGTILWFKGKPLNVDQSIFLLNEQPWLWFFPLHPLFFGVIFGAMGTIRQQKQSEISDLIEKLEREADVDVLTNLFNRRYFMNVFENECIRTQRGKNSLSIILFDLDDFKLVNDKYGHLVGDEVLKVLSKLFKKHSRPYDTIARWGGEEFIVMLPGANQNEAYEIADRIRETFKAHLFKEKSQKFNCTLSAGISQFEESIEDFSKLFDQADQALYCAKRNGKNRVEKYQK